VEPPQAHQDRGGTTWTQPGTGRYSGAEKREPCQAARRRVSSETYMAAPRPPRPVRNMRIDASLISRFSQVAYTAGDAAEGCQPAERGLLCRHPPTCPRPPCPSRRCGAEHPSADWAKRGWQTSGPHLSND
jgi:hypothetical protein